MKKNRLLLALICITTIPLTSCKEEVKTMESLEIQVGAKFDNFSLKVVDESNNEVQKMNKKETYHINLNLSGKFTGLSNSDFSVSIAGGSYFDLFDYDIANTANVTDLGEQTYKFNYMNKQKDEAANVNIEMEVIPSIDLEISDYYFITISLQNCFNADLYNYACASYDGLLQEKDSDGNSYISYGLYPQSVVTDEELISKLDAKYDENSSIIFLDGKNYYKLVSSSNKYKWKFSNGDKIKTNKRYYFSYDPVIYRVLSVDGYYLSEYVLDSYNNVFFNDVTGKKVYNFDCCDLGSMLNKENGFKRKRGKDSNRAAYATDFARLRLENIKSNGLASYTTNQVVPYNESLSYVVMPNGSFAKKKPTGYRPEISGGEL